MLYVFAHLSVQRTYHYFRSSVMNVVCVFSEQKKCEERDERENERSEREKKQRRKTTETERSCLPEKKRRAKNEKKIHSFSLSTNWRCASVVVRILILRITTTTTTIKASERCNNSSQKRSRKKRKKEARQGRARFFVRNKRD